MQNFGGGGGGVGLGLGFEGLGTEVLGFRTRVNRGLRDFCVQRCSFGSELKFRGGLPGSPCRFFRASMACKGSL